MQITSYLHSNVSRPTRINSSSVHTYIFVCFTLRVFLQGFVTQNATHGSQYPVTQCSLFKFFLKVTGPTVVVILNYYYNFHLSWFLKNKPILVSNPCLVFMSVSWYSSCCNSTGNQKVRSNLPAQLWKPLVETSSIIFQLSVLQN